MTESKHFERVRHTWERYGAEDPMFGVLSIPGKEGSWNEAEFYEYGRNEVATLFWQLEQAGVVPPTDRVLDFGCGVGRLSFALAATFDEVDGVDISPSMLDFANQHNEVGERCRFHLYQGSDLALFETGTFGMAVTLMVLQHVPPPMAERYIAELVRVVRPGGVVAFQMPGIALPKRLRSRVKTLMITTWRHTIRRKPRMEMHGRTPEEVARLVSAAGATVVAAIPDQRCGDWGPSFLHVAVKPAD